MIPNHYYQHLAKADRMAKSAKSTTQTAQPPVPELCASVSEHPSAAVTTTSGSPRSRYSPNCVPSGPHDGVGPLAQNHVPRQLPGTIRIDTIPLRRTPTVLVESAHVVPKSIPLKSESPQEDRGVVSDPAVFVVLAARLD